MRVQVFVFVFKYRQCMDYCRVEYVIDRINKYCFILYLIIYNIIVYFYDLIYSLY